MVVFNRRQWARKSLARDLFIVLGGDTEGLNVQVMNQHDTVLPSSRRGVVLLRLGSIRKSTVTQFIKEN